MKTHSTKRFWLSIGVALGLHALLFVVWSNYNNESFYEVSKTHNIEIKLTERKSSSSEKRSLKPIPKMASIKKTKSTNQQPTVPMLGAPASNKLVQANEQQTIKPVSIDKPDSSLFYKLLHSAINQQKHYPVRNNRNREKRLWSGLAGDQAVFHDRPAHRKRSRPSGYCGSC